MVIDYNIDHHGVTDDGEIWFFAALSDEGGFNAHQEAADQVIEYLDTTFPNLEYGPEDECNYTASNITPEKLKEMFEKDPNMCECGNQFGD